MKLPGKEHIHAANVPTLVSHHPFRRPAHHILGETDRVDALKSELQKVGVDIEELKVGEITSFPPELTADGEPIISTFEDHRMAMAFTPLACMFGQISIANPEVVQKSYPNFWDDLKSVGFTIEEVD